MTEQEFGCKTKIIQADYTRGPEMYQSIVDNLKGMEIGILVNNVGMSGSFHPKRFLAFPNIDKVIMDTINCNMLSVVQMTRIVLPQMVERKKGLVINLSSEAGSRPYPMGILYSSSKGFVDFFSRGLHAEYKSLGITVQCVMPLFVSTDMTQNIKTNIFVKSANDYARDALNTVGYTNRTSGCLSHALQMTRIVLPQMVERKKGLVINLSSEVGNRPYPMSLIYSSSKGFVDFFSRGLHAEYKSLGITVQCVMPLFVSTDMTHNLGTNVFVKSASDYARDALNTVGYTNRTSGCLSHALQSYALDLLIPDSVLEFVLSLKILADFFDKIQKKGDKKKTK